MMLDVGGSGGLAPINRVHGKTLCSVWNEKWQKKAKTILNLGAESLSCCICNALRGGGIGRCAINNTNSVFLKYGHIRRKYVSLIF
jgi:hypothetical protein